MSLQPLTFADPLTDPGGGQPLRAPTTGEPANNERLLKAKVNEVVSALDGKAPSSHTHPASQITDYASATRAQVEATILAGANVTVTPGGTGATRTLTIASTGGGGTGGGTAEGTTFTPTGGIAATNVQAALAEVDAEKAPVSHTHTAAQISNSTAVGRDVLTAVDATAARTALAAASSGHTHDARYPRTVNGQSPDPTTGDVSITVAPDPASFAEVKLTADSTPRTSTVLANDPTLTFNVGANETWLITLSVHYDGAANGDVNGDGDIKYAWALPTGATVFGNANGLQSGTATAQGSRYLLPIRDGSEQSAGTIGAGTAVALHVEFDLVTSSTAGSVTFQWAQRVANATTGTRLLARSVLTGIRR